MRTLQRRLARRGYTYSSLVDEARFEIARQLLGDPGMKVAEVALEVGYREQAHFTRAFRRFAGVAPREYRRLVTSHHAFSTNKWHQIARYRSPFAANLFLARGWDILSFRPGTSANVEWTKAIRI